MITLQYGQEVLFITNEGQELDCFMFDNFDAVIRYHVKGTGHSSNEFMTVFGIQHAHMLSASGNNRPYADKQVVVREGDTIIYREDRYVVKYMGDYSDALRFEPISPYTHCLEEEFKELADGYEAIENKLNEIIER